MKRILLLLLLSCCTVPVLLGIDSVPRVEKIFRKGFSIKEFIPGGHRGGIYDKGEKVIFSLVLNSAEDCTVEARIEVLDFYGKKCSVITKNIALSAGRNTFVKIPVKEPGRYGHYTLDGKFRINGQLAAVSQSAFAVIPPPPAEADTWFEIDGRNGHHLNDNTSIYKRIGVGSIGLINVRTVADPRLQAVAYRDFFSKPVAAKFARTVGYLGVRTLRAEKEPHRLQKEGFYPYSEATYRKYDEMVRECATLAKDTVKLWCIIVQEVDAAMTFAESPVAVMTDHVIRVKRYSRILREVNPDCKIAVMNSCGDDYFNNDFRYIRMLLKETAKYVDYFAIDGYSGTWNGVLSPLEGPEKGGKFKALMNAASRLAQEFRLPAKIIQAERGYFVPYTAAFNSPIVRDLANLNARSIIMAKAMPFVMYYSRHGACRWYTPFEVDRVRFEFSGHG